MSFCLVNLKQKIYQTIKNVYQQNITPLHVATKWGKANSVNLLLDSGAKIDVKTRVIIHVFMYKFENSKSCRRIYIYSEQFLIF